MNRIEWVDRTDDGCRFFGFRWGWSAVFWSRRQLMIYAGRVRPLSIGLPLERPSVRDEVVRVRIACGPLSLSWQPHRDLP